jgi:hypothetical protein
MESEGKVVVEMVGGRSTVTRCFSKYPLKFIVPNKVGFLFFICSIMYYMWALIFRHKQSESEAEAVRHVSFFEFFFRWVPLVLMLFGFIASPMVVALSLYVPSILLFCSFSFCIT